MTYNKFLSLKKVWQDRIWLADFLENNLPDSLPAPHVSIFDYESVNMEWIFPRIRYDVSLEIYLGDHRGEWQGTNAINEEVTHKTLDLDDSKDWQWVIENLTGITALEKTFADRPFKSIQEWVDAVISAAKVPGYFTEFMR